MPSASPCGRSTRAFSCRSCGALCLISVRRLRSSLLGSRGRRRAYGNDRRSRAKGCAAARSQYSLGIVSSRRGASTRFLALVRQTAVQKFDLRVQRRAFLGLKFVKQLFGQLGALSGGTERGSRNHASRLLSRTAVLAAQSRELRIAGRVREVTRAAK